MRSTLKAGLLSGLLAALTVPEARGQENLRSVASVASTDLSSRLEATWELLQAGRRDFPLYRLLREALDSNDPGMLWYGKDRFLRADLFARERVASLGGERLKAWRRFAEPEARAFLRSSTSPPGLEVLLAAVARYPNTIAGARASLGLADIRIEEGTFDAALETVEEALSWTLEEEDARALRGREAFLHRRLGFRSPKGVGASLREDSGHGMRLVASFGRFLGKAVSPEPASSVSSVPRMFITSRAVFTLEPHRVVEFPLGPRGALSGPARVRRFAGTLQEACAFGGRLFAVTRAEEQVWLLPSGRKPKPTNVLFAIEPGREYVLWTVEPKVGTENPRHPPVFVSGPVAWGDVLAVVVGVGGAGGAQELSLVLLDPATGAKRGARFLFVGAPSFRRSKPAAPPLSWSLLARGGRLFACDGRGAILCVDARGVRWIRPYSAPYRARAPDAPSSPLAAAAGRLLVSPGEAETLFNLRARDGARLGACVSPPIRFLSAGRGAGVWVQTDSFVARVDAGEPVPRFRFRRAFNRSASGPGFSFGTLFVVPTSRRLVMVGSSGAFVRSLVTRGPASAFQSSSDRLYRVRGRLVAAFRVPRSRDELALCALPFIAGAPPDRALELLWPWLEGEERYRRIWAAGFLRDRLGQEFDFDPDAPPEERSESLKKLGKRFRGG